MPSSGPDPAVARGGTRPRGGLLVPHVPAVSHADFGLDVVARARYNSSTFRHWSRVIPLLFVAIVERSMQPCPGERPVTLDRRGRGLQGVRRFFDVHAAEEPAFDDAGETRIAASRDGPEDRRRRSAVPGAVPPGASRRPARLAEADRRASGLVSPPHSR